MAERFDEKSHEPKMEVNTPPSPRAKALESIRNKLGELPPPQDRPSIYKVNKPLRSVNEKAYDPQILAIGPYHRGKDNLKMMEKHKLRFLKEVIRGTPHLRVEDIIAAAAEEEQKARDGYAEPTDHITSADFIEMLVLDGCFIIQLLLFEVCSSLPTYDPIFQTSWILNYLKQDMMLFENQLPFFVLCKLSDLILAPNQQSELIYPVRNSIESLCPGAAVSTNQQSKLIYLVRNFFEPLCPGAAELKEITSSSSCDQDVKHILDLLHRHWSSSNPPIRDDGDDVRIRVTKKKYILDLLHRLWSSSNPPTGDDDGTIGKLFINSAAELEGANVEFRVPEEANITMFNVQFSDGIISMPTLTIDDFTDSVLRNLIAYEQYLPEDRPTSFTDYAVLLDCLINSSMDVNLLSERGVIESHLGHSEAVANIFNRITDSVTINSSFRYENTFKNINKYYRRKKNRAIAKLKRDYFSSPWAYISFFAALLLLLLTIAQTVLSAVQLS